MLACDQLGDHVLTPVLRHRALHQLALDRLARQQLDDLRTRLFQMPEMLALGARVGELVHGAILPSADVDLASDRRGQVRRQKKREPKGSRFGSVAVAPP